MGSKALYKYTV